MMTPPESTNGQPLTTEQLEQAKRYILKSLPQILEQTPEFVTFVEGVVAEKFPRRTNSRVCWKQSKRIAGRPGSIKRKPTNVSTESKNVSTRSISVLKRLTSASTRSTNVSIVWS